MTEKQQKAWDHFKGKYREFKQNYDRKFSDNAKEMNGYFEENREDLNNDPADDWKKS